MKLVSFLLILVVVFSFTHAWAVLPPRDNLELFLIHDVILVGTVVSEKQLSSDDPLASQTEYVISVSRYLKSPVPPDNITVIGSGAKDAQIHHSNEIILSTGQNVLLFIDEHEEKNMITPYSRPIVSQISEDLIPRPLQLFKNGVEIEDIVCKLPLELVIRQSEEPACVKESSVETLIDRGWAKPTNDKI